MNVRSIGLAAQTMSMQQQHQELSSTDWKVYAKVVLSYFLMGIGLALACSSPFIAFTINPMVAAAAPLTPIVAAVLLQNPPPETKPMEQPRRLAAIEKRPVGIKNEAANCWINATLQLLFNLPAYNVLMEKVLDSSDPKLALIRDAYKTYKAGGNVDSQKIREWLHERNPRYITLDASQHVEFEECLEPLLLAIRYSLPKEVSHLITRTGEDSKVDRRPDFSIKFHFDISKGLVNTKTGPKTFNVSNALKYYFYNSETSVQEKKETNVITWNNKPEDFGITFVLNDDKYQKVKDPKIEGAMEVSLAEELSNDSHYFLDGFIRHDGTSNGGHYIAYILKEGVWWEISDNVPAKPLLRGKDVEKQIANACFLHYQKKSPATASA